MADADRAMTEADEALSLVRDIVQKSISVARQFEAERQTARAERAELEKQLSTLRVEILAADAASKRAMASADRATEDQDVRSHMLLANVDDYILRLANAEGLMKAAQLEASKQAARADELESRVEDMERQLDAARKREASAWVHVENIRRANS